jgi:hypothetical protein
MCGSEETRKKIVDASADLITALLTSAVEMLGDLAVLDDSGILKLSQVSLH